MRKGRKAQQLGYDGENSTFLREPVDDKFTNSVLEHVQGEPQGIISYYFQLKIIAWNTKLSWLVWEWSYG